MPAAPPPAFRIATDSDDVWSCFLPELPPLADGELESAPPFKKAMFMCLSDHPVLLADDLMSMWLDRESGAKCYMLSAKALSAKALRILGIVREDGLPVRGDIQLWRWIPLADSRFFVLRGACAREALSPSGLISRSRCWHLGTVALCCASARPCTETLQWTSVALAVTLMLATETSIQKFLLVPFFALQAPSSAISWIKGEHGRWTALFGLLMCLLRLIPGELELLVSTMLLVILAPDQFMNLRGSEGGEVLSLAIAAYLMFQHFAGVGGLRKAFGREAIITTLSLICMTVIALMLVH